jgi:RNA polymerase sigma-70 factor (ECF subfamily)
LTADRGERFEEIVSRHGNSVLSYISRRWQFADALDPEDLLADVLSTAWIHLDSIPDGLELAWLYGAARNRLMNARARSTRRRKLLYALRPRPLEPSAEDTAVARVGLISAIERLSPRDREILSLEAWEGLSVREIAVALGITENAATVRLSRARTSLLSHLQRSNDLRNEAPPSKPNTV